MKLKYTKTTLSKLEQIFKDIVPEHMDLYDALEIHLRSLN